MVILLENINFVNNNEYKDIFINQELKIGISCYLHNTLEIRTDNFSDYLYKKIFNYYLPKYYNYHTNIEDCLKFLLGEKKEILIQPLKNIPESVYKISIINDKIKIEPFVMSIEGRHLRKTLNQIHIKNYE